MSDLRRFLFATPSRLALAIATSGGALCARRPAAAALESAHRRA
ncbi:MAG TPA: hypothetical protein VGG29_20910 [Caulobacteraceae bacterium]|jgi:hypothetical protein